MIKALICLFFSKSLQCSWLVSSFCVDPQYSCNCMSLAFICKWIFGQICRSTTIPSTVDLLPRNKCWDPGFFGSRNLQWYAKVESIMHNILPVKQGINFDRDSWNSFMWKFTWQIFTHFYYYTGVVSNLLWVGYYVPSNFMHGICMNSCHNWTLLQKVTIFFPLKLYSIPEGNGMDLLLRDSKSNVKSELDEWQVYMTFIWGKVCLMIFVLTVNTN